MPAKSLAFGAPDSRLWLLLIVSFGCRRWNRTSTPAPQEQETRRRRRPYSSARLRPFDDGCPAPRPGAHATDASDSGLPVSQFYECLIPQLYNEQRLHSALGYVTPLARLQGRQTEIQAARDRKLEQARQQREQTARSRRKSATSPSCEKVA
jgi:hypothetical protein